MCDLLGRTGRQSVVLDERFLAFTAPLRQFRQGELVLSAQPLQRGGEIATDLGAQKLFQRIAVPGHRNPDPHPVAELARCPLRRGLDLPVFGGLDVFPFRQKVAALCLVRFEIALEIVRLVFQRAQFFDLLTKLRDGWSMS